MAARPPLVRVLQSWNRALLDASSPVVRPLLRIEGGAALLQTSRSAQLDRMVAPLLVAAGPNLSGPPRGLAGAVVRPKVQVVMSQGGFGLLAAVHYFGQPPDSAAMQRVAGGCEAGECVFPPAVDARAITLRLVRPEPVRRLAVVHVLAGRRQVALPMFGIAHAATEDEPPAPELEIHSLARCLGEEEQPASGRPAVLQLRCRGTPVALRVELLVGHESERILPTGPVLYGTPWLLGVIERADAEPVLVLDPLVLIRARATGS